MLWHLLFVNFIYKNHILEKKKENKNNILLQETLKYITYLNVKTSGNFVENEVEFSLVFMQICCKSETIFF